MVYFIIIKKLISSGPCILGTTIVYDKHILKTVIVGFSVMTIKVTVFWKMEGAGFSKTLINVYQVCAVTSQKTGIFSCPC
jgi:hypothetical protein